MPARALGRAAGDQGDHARRRRDAGGRARRRRDHRLQPRRPPARSRAGDDRGAAAVAEAVDGRAEVYLDSGVRRGTDIVKALALGARAVLVGRPLVYGLGAAGEAGARRAFELLRAELATALALAGYPRVSELGPRRGYVKSPSSGCQFGTPLARSAYWRSAASSGVWGVAAWWGNGGASASDGACWGVSCASSQGQTLNAGPADPLLPRADDPPGGGCQFGDPASTRGRTLRSLPAFSHGARREWPHDQRPSPPASPQPAFPPAPARRRGGRHACRERAARRSGGRSRRRASAGRARAPPGKIPTLPRVTTTRGLRVQGTSAT